MLLFHAPLPFNTLKCTNFYLSYRETVVNLFDGNGKQFGF